MEWYYVITIILSIVGLFWAKLAHIENKLFNHLSHYSGFVSEVKTTIKFFRKHFDELDDALNQKENKG